MSAVTMREMLEAGVHFGHQTRFWNPKMGPYLYGQRNKIHIINLEKTLPLFQDAVNFAGKLAARKNNILFVGTKKAAQKIIQEEATRCAMPYINRRWLGGLLTNFKTVKQSISRLKQLEEMESDGSLEKVSKKEGLLLMRELDKLRSSLSGIKDMPGMPQALFVIDVGYENIAIKEAVKLGIPVIGVVDSNNNPDGIDYVIPGNDDAIRSIQLYARYIADAIIDARGSVSHLGGSGDAEDFVELDEAGDPIASEKTGKKTTTRKKTTKKKRTAAAAGKSEDDTAAQAADDSAVAEVDAVAEIDAVAEGDDKATTSKKTTRKKAVKKKTTGKAEAAEEGPQ